MSGYGIPATALTKDEWESIVARRGRNATDGPLSKRPTADRTAPDGTPDTVFGVNVTTLLEENLP